MKPRTKRGRSVVALATVLVLCTFAASAAEPGVPRTTQPLADGWRFAFGSFTEVQSSGFDDASWEKVSIPHTWNLKDGCDGGNNYKRGTGWYRLRFTPAAPLAGRRSYLRFDAVCMVSTVWLNGTELGRHTSGFSAACYDVTDVLKPGENLLVVFADNSYNPDIPPLSGDFTLYGGIYRTVSLITAAPVSIDLLDHASPGIYLTTPTITADQGTVKASVRVRNAGPAASSATVTTTLLDAAGATVARGTAQLTVAPGTVAEPVVELTVPQPHLWQGRADPYLYQAVVEVAAAGATDRVVQPLAFRTLRIDPELGCFLNGKPYDLHGANLHQDRDGKAWNATNADREEDLRLMFEMGCTFVRLAHYQHDQSTYDYCDRLGLLVWAENCLVDRITDNEAFIRNNVEQLTDLIRQNDNHPCILNWSIGNEMHNGGGPDSTPLLKTLAGVARSEDPTRPSAVAACNNEAPDRDGADLIAHNRYFGWYHGLPADFAGWLDQMHRKYPRACIGISEYGAGANTQQHELPAKKPNPNGNWHPEEWQNTYHEVYWITMKQRSWIWCKEVWAFCDFASDKRNEGDQPGINDKGLVTRDRQLKKDSYFWYQANWTDAPMVYITSRRFVHRTTPTTEVKFYSNCPEAELRVNGISLGIKKVEDCRGIWPAVTLKPGENVIQAVSRKNGKTVKDQCTWILEPGKQ